MAGTYGAKALSVFPDIKGTTLALMNAIRQFLAVILVLISELFFNGTIVPVATIIFCYSMVIVIFHILSRQN